MKRMISFLLAILLVASCMAAQANSYQQLPEIPQSDGLQAAVVEFKQGNKYDVYAGPGEHYGRAGEGKARVSTNEYMQVFGQENGWILIQYVINDNHCRFGYIPASALPNKVTVPALEWYHSDAYTTELVSVTDDPLRSRTEFATLLPNTPVTWLATLGDWAYIEHDMLRGFIPLGSIVDGDRAHHFSTVQEGDSTYNLFTIQKLHFDGDHNVTAVTGFYERIVEGDECVESESLPNSTVTYPLSADFHAQMVGSMNGDTLDNIPVTDLYHWYLQAYLDCTELEHEMVFACDLKTEEE